ncbi:MAG: TonB-dependent receptor [Bacteroidales bacterium]
MKLLSKVGFFLVASLLGINVAAAQNGVIRGVIYDYSSGLTVPGANIRMEGNMKGAISNENGGFQLTRLESKQHTLIISVVGYKTDTLLIDLTDKAFEEKNFFLHPKTYSVGEVTIQGFGLIEKTKTNISVYQITSKDLKMIPGFGGYADLAQAMQVLPGVVFTGDQGGQLYIRGGSPSMNKVLMDGMTIYSPFHSMGLFSIFNSDAIQSADVYTAGFGAQYNGRISSIMDIRMRDGNPRQFSAKGSIDPFQSELLVEGPLIRQKEGQTKSLSFLITGKKSLIDLTGKSLYPYLDSVGLPFAYQDLYGKVTLHGEGGNQLQFSGFRNTDHVNFPGLVSLDWLSSGLGFQATFAPYGSKGQIIPYLNYSGYEIHYLANDTLLKTSRIGGFEGGLRVRYQLNYDELEFGAGLDGFNTLTDFKNTVGNRFYQEDNSSDLTGYAKYVKRLDKVILEGGISLIYYGSLTVFSPEPRLRLKYKLSDRFHIKAGIGWYSQNLLTTTSDRDVVNLFNGYIASPQQLQEEIFGVPIKNHLQRARHYVIGFDWLGNKSLEFSGEAYLKDFNQLINVNRNKLYQDSPENSDKPAYLKKTYIVEQGYSYGLDLNFSYHLKGFNLSGNYSLSWNTRTDEVQRYTPHFDRRHTINLLANFSFGKSKTWTISARWNLGSGLPFTQTRAYYELLDPFKSPHEIGESYIPGELGVIYAGYNQGRLPAYHRLDINLRKSISLKFMTINLSAGIVNAYDRHNLFYFDRLKYKLVYQLPFIPTIGAVFQFNSFTK